LRQADVPGTLEQMLCRKAARGQEQGRLSEAERRTVLVAKAGELAVSFARRFERLLPFNCLCQVVPGIDQVHSA